jgi:tRNA threonylcarbamoyladenosine biosynthesis protein TsaB
MKVLAFDTSSVQLAVGVADDGILLASSEVESSKHSESLVSSIQACLGKADIEAKDIDLFACILGPGSFMGLRIGMATAKGFSLALNKPWVGVPTLDAIALPYATSDLVIPILDGRKNRLYAALFRRGARASEYLDISAGQLLGMLDGEQNALFVGPDADIMEEYCLERSGFAYESYNPRSTVLQMAILAEQIFSSQGPGNDDASPLYLREPEIG